MKIFDKIWESAEPTIKLISLQYQMLSRNLPLKSAKRLSDLEMHFQRGIFEQCCLNHNLEKSMHKDAIIYCYYQYFKYLNLEITEDKFHKFSLQCFNATNIAYVHTNSIAEMSLKIHNSAKNAFKKGPGDCIVAIKKIYDEPYYSFDDIPLVKSIKNFFNII